MLELTRLEKAIDIGYYKEALTRSLEKVYYVTFNFSVRTDFLNIFLNDNMDEIALINLSLDPVDEQYIIEKGEIEKQLLQSVFSYSMPVKKKGRL